tara:strand:- start:13174 stop:15021 length:1848 start_codon:yes stop_codon:yes gene_type:complete
MTWRLSDLAWLPPYESSFRDECHAIAQADAPDVDALIGLAQFRLSEPQLNRLSKTRKSLGAAVNFPTQLRLGILSNANFDLILPIIEASAMRYSLDVDAHAALFGQGPQQAFDPASYINTDGFDFILVAFSHHGLPISEGYDTCVAYLRDIYDALKRNASAAIIFQTIPNGMPDMFGHFDARREDTAAAIVTLLNQFLRDSLLGPDDYLLDAARMAEAVGLEAWHHPGLWNLAKIPFSQHCTPFYSDHVARLLGAIYGRSKKCLVLDLDNTLWGGVIGDDGLEGIRIGQHDAQGEAFLAIQQYAKALRTRGIILAVCSKNDETNARRPFQEHDAMVLREDDIAVFQANWSDKASNLEAIAQKLNIGVDALVLLDDNPAERAQVRQELPMVGVPELPDDPALYVFALQAAGYFEAVTFSDADSARAAQYQANAQRADLADATKNLGAFLQSLQMEISFKPFDASGRNRISQLINKSNQFNLTTRRYTASEVAALESDPDVFTLQVSLKDRFGDNGMICVVICRSDEDAWVIDTWLMSCRVLGRRVEEVVLAHIVNAAKQHAVHWLRGIFVPSGRNDLVREHYEKLGFARTQSDSNVNAWLMSTADFEEQELPFIIA